MTLTRQRLTKSISKNLRCSKCESEVLLKSLLEILINTLASGEDVLISGFGKFRIKRRNQRSHRPYYGSTDLSGALAFKCSPVLAGRLNNHLTGVDGERVFPARSMKSDEPRGAIHHVEKDARQMKTLSL